MAAREIGAYVKVGKIALDFENPRHEPLDSPTDVIEYLCKEEDILPLARDIARHGVNPLELLAVLPGSKRGTFVSKEGNRRLCAVKILTDPDLAPANIRKTIEKLSEEWTPIIELPVVLFSSQEEIDVWLQRIHNGTNGGIGRKRWNAQQQARHTGEGRNKLALEILDYAEDIGAITAKQRKNRITTVQRYLSNVIMREALGLDLTDPDGTNINRPTEDFDAILRKFMADLLDEQVGLVTSRRNKKEIEAYARELMRMRGLSGRTIEPKPIVKPVVIKGKRKKVSKPRKPAVPNRLPYDDQIADALKTLENYKLSSLYFSICDVSLSQHTPLVSVGLWSFMESLTTLIGSKTDISSFFSKSRIATYGLNTGKYSTGVSQAIGRVANYGNTTKHDPTAAHFDAKQLANDFETMRELILKCVEDAISRKP